jgi:hypothetical protein
VKGVIYSRNCEESARLRDLNAQLLVVTPSGIAFVIMARSMQAKYEGRGASMGLGFGVAGSSMKRVYMI